MLPTSPKWLQSHAARRVVAALLILSVIAAVPLVGVTSYLVAFHSSLEPSDQLSAINDIIASGALLLAAVTGLLAVRAYVSENRVPEVRLQLRLESDTPNALRVVTKLDSRRERRATGLDAERALFVRAKNLSDKEARHLSVTLEFINFTIDDLVGSGWTVVDAVYPSAVTAVIWDCPFLLQQGSTRKSGSLSLQDFRQIDQRERCSITAKIAADGYRRETSVDVRIVDTALGDQHRPAIAPPEWI